MMIYTIFFKGSHCIRKRKRAKSYDDMLANVRSDWKQKYRKSSDISDADVAFLHACMIIIIF